MHTTINTLSTEPSPWVPEPGTAMAARANLPDTRAASGEADGLYALARSLEKVLCGDPVHRRADALSATVEVYTDGGLIYVRTLDGTKVADLFPSEARTLVAFGLLRIQHSLR